MLGLLPRERRLRGRRADPDVQHPVLGGMLSYTSRRLASGRKTAKVVVADAAGNTAQTAWAFRVR
jgi:hypothetical protein